MGFSIEKVWFLSAFICIFSFLAGYVIRWIFAGERIKIAEHRARELKESTEREVENRKKESELAARDLLIKVRQDFEKETKDRREEVLQVEKRILQREEKKRLQVISNLTPEEAKKILLSRLDDDLVHEKASRIRRAEDEIKETVDKKARFMISTAIQRCASDHTAETKIG